MSNSGEENSGSDSTDDRGHISDDQLPEDLRPSENPLARDPDDDDSPDEETGPGAAAEGLPDMGEPGTT